MRNQLYQRTALFGVLTALGLIFGYVESFIPIPLGIPGIKLGLANVVVVVALPFLPPAQLYLLSFLRVVLAGFIFGNAFSILYSLSGALLSLTVMLLLQKKDFSMLGISVAGGVSHNIGQLIMACIVVENISLLYYAPILLLAGVVTGMIIGSVSLAVKKHLVKMQP